MESFIEVKDPSEIEAVAGLAREIWNEHFRSIISPAQIDYMLEKFQSYPAISAAIRQEVYRYFLIPAPPGTGESSGPNPEPVLPDGPYAGYFAVQPRPDCLFLSKLYIRKSNRGRGLARKSLAFCEALARAAGLSPIRLTCNRHNSGSLAAYRALGFTVAAEQRADIGGGFFMDDYILEKAVSPAP